MVFDQVIWNMFYYRGVGHIISRVNTLSYDLSVKKNTCVKIAIIVTFYHTFLILTQKNYGVLLLSLHDFKNKYQKVLP